MTNPECQHKHTIIVREGYEYRTWNGIEDTYVDREVCLDCYEYVDEPESLPSGEADLDIPF